MGKYRDGMKQCSFGQIWENHGGAGEDSVNIYSKRKIYSREQ